MNLEELRATLIKWLNELKTWYLPDHSWDDYVEIKTEDYERVEAVFYTENYAISMVAHPHEGDRCDGLAGYIWCLKQRPGESWTRGNDLPDGEFKKETFNAILMAALAHGVVAKVKPQKAIVDGGTCPLPPPRKE